ncbi:MAG: ATP-binding protein [Coriobacteriales bacterium]|nr:ATP-binding protein [Coriobacteriales bacterium]
MRKGNPFTPTFGHVPFALAGREDYIDDVVGGLANGPGDPNRTTVFVGPRGSGKTVLLTTIAREASSVGWICVDSSARAGMLNTIARRLEKNAAHLLEAKPTSHVVGVQFEPVGVTRELQDGPVPSALQRIEDEVEFLCNNGSSVLFTVDEVDARCTDFCDFVDLYQFFMRNDLDVALIIAGLPSHVSILISDDGISFIRRAFQRPLDMIPIVEVEQAIADTIEQNGKTIE